jgi:hypothetical protein
VQHELQWWAVVHMSSDLVHVRWRIMEFSLSMKHLSVHLEFSTHFANPLNPEQSQSHEVLETLRIHHVSS